MPFGAQPEDSNEVPISSVYVANTGFKALRGSSVSTDGSSNDSAAANIIIESGTITANAGTGTFTDQHSNVTSDYDTGGGTQTTTMYGLALPASGGAVSGGTSTNPVRTDPTGTTTQPVSGTVSITSNSSVNMAQVAGTTTDTNSGNKSAGTQRVVLATDQPALTNALKVNEQATTSGGSTPYHLISAGSTNATNVKSSAGQVYGFSISNVNAAARFFKLYDKATSPTIGTDTPKMTIQVPANATVVRAFPEGLEFTLGIGFGTTTGMVDSNTGAVTANDLSIDINYK